MEMRKEQSIINMTDQVSKIVKSLNEEQRQMEEAMKLEKERGKRTQTIDLDFESRKRDFFKRIFKEKGFKQSLFNENPTWRKWDDLSLVERNG